MGQITEFSEPLFAQCGMRALPPCQAYSKLGEMTLAQCLAQAGLLHGSHPLCLRQAGSGCHGAAGALLAASTNILLQWCQTLPGVELPKNSNQEGGQRGLPF